MSPISLTADYQTGVEAIDAEHRFFCKLYNDMVSMIETADTAELLTAAVRALSAYADHHFANEETAMEDIAYPDLKHHRLQHEAFKNALNDLVSNRSRNDTAAILNLASFAGRWLRGHILITDKAFGEYAVAARLPETKT